MQRLALLFSVAALGGAGWLGWTAADLSRELKSQTEAHAALESRLAVLEHAAAQRPAPSAPTPAAAHAPDAHPVAAPSATLGGSARPVGLPDLDRRLAKLEKLLEGAVTDMPEGVVSRVGQTVEEPVNVDAAAGPTYFASVEDAQRHLELSPGQKTEFERIVTETKKEIEDLRKIPDDEGKTWDQVQKDGVTFDGGTINYDGSKLQAFREKTIPGRSESFGAAERRIADDAKKHLRDTLSHDQQAKFDKSRVDGMLGTGGGGDFLTMINFSGIDVAPPPLPAPPPPAVPPEGMEGK